MTCRILPYSATVVELTNHNFPSPGWKIAIGPLSTSALAALKNLTYNQFRALFGRQPRRHLRGDFLCTSFASYGSISYVFLLCFIVLLKQVRRLYTGGFIFQVPPVYNYSTCYTNRVLTRSVHQVRVYAFGAPTTRLRVWCTYKAVTNQGEVLVYRLYSLLQYKRQSPLSKRAYNTIRISCP